MLISKLKRCQTGVLLIGLLLCLTVVPSVAGLNDLFGKKEIDETERKETIERIDSIQEKLKLLQDKLRVLERRKAPGEFGLYTYLLFKGKLSDTSSVGVLEDFILTIETLPENEIPAGLANRFLIPVEKPQSMVSLGRQPYDFKLNDAYLQRLELQDKLPPGPILVSLREPLDPYGIGDIPAFMAVSFGRQTPQRALDLAKIWHQQEKNAIPSKGHPVSELFWELIDGAGTTQVAHYQQRILVALPQ
jgi:hypothetical protein